MSAPRFGGMPTDVDVRALFEAFGVPAIGAAFHYAQVAEAINVPLASYRFRTVTWAWRMRLIREHNVYVRAGAGQFQAMDASERVDYGSAKLRTGVRAMRKAHTVVGSTDRASLTEEAKKQADHVLLMSATVIQSARVAAARRGPVLTDGVK